MLLIIKVTAETQAYVVIDKKRLCLIHLTFNPRQLLSPSMR